MKFFKTKIDGVFRIELERFEDERGGFARCFCAEEFAKAGISFETAQCNISTNLSRGTLRGMHFQGAPYPEPKIVSCPRGEIYDVLMDIRKDSPSYLQWQSFNLSAENGRMLYIPPYVAHGFQTLRDNSTVLYQLGAPFNASTYAGIRYNDGAFNAQWPISENIIISERDASYPDFIA